MIAVRNLRKEFDGFVAVDDISFSVARGETCVLLGTSGCGKTTTLRMINRLEEPTAGDVHVEGTSVFAQKPTELRRRIGYVIQNIGLFPHYTVEQNISVVPRLLRWANNCIRSRTIDLLEMVGLPPDEFLNRYPQELSGGQQQRVGLARAFAADPPVVLLDEPFGALDPITRRQIQKEFKQLDIILDKTMILVTHDVFEAFDLGDKICLMDKGQIQQVGTPKDLIFSPKRNFVRDFFQSNRLLLELKVLQLKDLIPEITEVVPSPENVKKFKESDCVFDVLEAMEESKDLQTLLCIVDASQRKIRVTNTSHILVAFNKMKSRLMV